MTTGRRSKKKMNFEKEFLEYGSRLRVGKVLAPYNACPKARRAGLHCTHNATPIRPALAPSASLSNHRQSFPEATTMELLGIASPLHPTVTPHLIQPRCRWRHRTPPEPPPAATLSSFLKLISARERETPSPSVTSLLPPLAARISAGFYTSASEQSKEFKRRRRQHRLASSSIPIFLKRNVKTNSESGKPYDTTPHQPFINPTTVGGNASTANVALPVSPSWLRLSGYWIRLTQSKGERNALWSSCVDLCELGNEGDTGCDAGWFMKKNADEFGSLSLRVLLCGSNGNGTWYDGVMRVGLGENERVARKFHCVFGIVRVKDAMGRQMVRRLKAKGLLMTVRSSLDYQVMIVGDGVMVLGVLSLWFLISAVMVNESSSPLLLRQKTKFQEGSALCFLWDFLLEFQEENQSLSLLPLPIYMYTCKHCCLLFDVNITAYHLKLQGKNDKNLYELHGLMMETELGGQCRNWAYEPAWKLGLRAIVGIASVETGLMGQAKLGLGVSMKLGLWASIETGLRGQARWAYGSVWKLGLGASCGNWAYGPVWKLGLWASVKLGLWARRAGLRGQCGNWAYGPVRKLGLWASAETGLMGQCGNWAYGPVWKLGLWARRTGLMARRAEPRGQYGNWAYGPCGNWAYGPVWKLGLWVRRNWAYGLVWKLGLGASVETGLMGQIKLGLWARRAGLRGQCGNWAYGSDETGLLGGQVKLGFGSR
ncbi:hypothetical protein V8G54_037341 [Vigna mungo]|uniref:Uncharacterized protein n=1 Tax=Vigna mungo TaxID=3915 RepID=A0AAQ3RGE7_VIGMU